MEPVQAARGAAPPRPLLCTRAGALQGWWMLAAVCCAAQMTLWASGFALTYSAPGIDSAEQFVWAFSVENGYWKHPPLPSWILHVLMRVFGPSVALSFFATHACVAIALLLSWRLGCEFMSPHRSLIAMALTSLVDYHTIGADCFNHNTALLPFQAGMVLMFWRAMHDGQWHRWALAGLLAGLAMLVKYVALMPIAGLLLAALLDARMHRWRQLAGIALAAFVCMLVLLPHLLWLQRTDFLPFRYAQAMTEAVDAGAALRSIADFVVMQFVRVAPLLLGLIIVLRSPDRDAVFGASGEAPAQTQGSTRFLWIVGLAPIALTLAFGIVTDTPLQSRWGANAFLLSGWLAMAASSRADSPAMLKRCLKLASIAHVVLCLTFTLSKTALADHLGRRTRANFPGSVLAEHAKRTWRLHAAVPLRVVVSDIWLGGNLVANSPRALAVLIDGQPTKSPWVSEQSIAECGALVLDDLTADDEVRGEPHHPALDALMRRADATGVWELPWADAGMRPAATGQVRWGIILPVGGAACPLE